MPSTRTSRTERGFSLIEALVAITLVSVVLAAAGGMMATSRNFVQQQILRIETTQALRATLDTLARDLRLGGACLPTTGSFLALSGTDAGTADTVVTRHGLIKSDLSCVSTALKTGLKASDTQLTVDTIAGFAPGMLVYISSGGGEFFTITGVQPSGSTLQKSTTLSTDYPIGSGVYAIDERRYAIDASNASMPVLTLTTNGGAPSAFASGVESVNVQYQLARNCPACDVVDLPANDDEWALVKQLYVTVGVRSRVQGSDGRYFRCSGQIKAKPRNLLPE